MWEILSLTGLAIGFVILIVLWLKVMFSNSIPRDAVCAYCGTPTVVNGKRVIDGACPCKVPALPPGVDPYTGLDTEREFKVEVSKQGAPIVNCEIPAVYVNDGRILIAEIDMHSKWCDVCYSRGTSIGIEATERALHLKEDVDREAFTEISFPNHSDGWYMFNVNLQRYTLRLVLVKEEVIFGEGDSGEPEQDTAQAADGS